MKNTKKLEEEKIIAEMEEAMKEQKEQAVAGEETAQEQTQQYHCRKCKTLMENGVCPTCGFRIYMGMDKDKQKKIRLITGIVCLAVLLVILLIKS